MDASNTVIFSTQGTEETVRVVSMDRDFHVDCYHCEVSIVQLSKRNTFTINHK